MDDKPMKKPANYRNQDGCWNCQHVKRGYQGKLFCFEVELIADEDCESACVAGAGICDKWGYGK